MSTGATGAGGGAAEGAVGTGSEGTASGAQEQFKPIESQEELDSLLGARAKREAAKFADYKDLKKKAEEFDKLAEANKTEIDKANDRATAAEAEAAKSLIEARKLRIATKFGISDEDADLFLTGADEETLTKQAEGLSKIASDRKKNGNVVPKEGSTSTAAPGDERAFVRELFQG